MDVSTSHAAFNVTSRLVGCCQVVELIGELDIATAPILKAALDEIESIPDHIKVDMSRLDFIDSTGLRLLLGASELVNGRIWLKGTSSSWPRCSRWPESPIFSTSPKTARVRTVSWQARPGRRTVRGG